MPLTGSVFRTVVLPYLSASRPSLLPLATSSTGRRPISTSGKFKGTVSYSHAEPSRSTGTDGGSLFPAWDPYDWPRPLDRRKASLQLHPPMTELYDIPSYPFPPMNEPSPATLPSTSISSLSTLPNSSNPTVAEILERHRPPPSTSRIKKNQDLADLDSRTRTAVSALRTIIEIHESETVRAKEEVVSPSVISNSTPRHALPPFPPVINQLLRTRHFRLAVFHILNTPSFATDPELIDSVAKKLEKSGSGHLAARLRNLTTEGSKAKLPPGHGLPNGYWETHNLPPDPTELRPSRWSERQKVTQYFNARLSFLVRPSPQTAISPLDPLFTSHDDRPNTWPEPNASFRQLKTMLITIARYQRRHGFRPDRVTANIILHCWLNCGLSRPPLDPYLSRLDRDGALETSRKRRSNFPDMRTQDVLLIFRGVSLAVSRGLDDMDPKKAYQEGEVTWTRHVSPLVKMFLMALKWSGEYHETKGEVLEWSTKVKARLRIIGELRRHDANVNHQGKREEK